MLVYTASSKLRLPREYPFTDKLRPSFKRISTTGLIAPGAGKETIGACPGPMAVDRDALEIFMKVALSAKPWRIDPSLILKEWTPFKFASPPKIAIQWWDGVVQPHPPMTRALRQVSEHCRKAGMEVVDWNCEHLEHQRAWEITSALYWPDGGEEVLGLLKEGGEPVLPLTKFIIEQPAVKNLTQYELWEVKFSVFYTKQTLILLAVPATRPVPHYVR
jgi:amidase